MQGFTRQEALTLTGLTSGKLTYWDKTGLVSPEKIGNPKHPTVIYSWQQLLQLKLISRLRERLSLQEIRKVLDFLTSHRYNPSIFNCHLVFVGSQLYLIENLETFGTIVLEASGKNKGQIVIQEIGTISEVIQSLVQEAHEQHIENFDRRVRGTPLAVK